MKALILLLLLPVSMTAQHLNSTESTQGTIVVTPIFKLNLSVQTPLQFSFITWEDFSQPKVFPSVLSGSITSTKPWLLTVASTDENFTAGGNGSKDMPVSLLSVKNATSNHFLPLSNSHQVILQNQNSQVFSSFLLDFKMDVPWNFKGDQYSTSLVFSLSEQ